MYIMENTRHLPKLLATLLAAVAISGCLGQKESSVADDVVGGPGPAPAPTPPPASGSNFPGVPEYPYRAQLPDLGDPADVTTCSRGSIDANGTADDWVVITVNENDDCDVDGSYYVIQNSTFNDGLGIFGGPLAVRNSEITAPGTGGAVLPRGTNILFEDNVVRDNGVIPSSSDHHGINVLGNTSGLWILNNSIYLNSGDAIQFCHSCIGGSHDGPELVFIAGNVMHDDEENAIDLKEFVGPVVAVCNEMYGYERSSGSNGDAVRINDEGQQGEVWFSKNTYRNNVVDIAPYSSDAEGYYLDEEVDTFNDNSSSNTVAHVSGAAAQPYYDQYQAQYGLDLSAACPQ